MKLNRLYIFTGKGGVGKTTLAVAFTKYLKLENKKAKLVYFKNSKLDDNPTVYSECRLKAEQAGIDYIGLDLLESAQSYIAKKLNSTTIASWVVKTPFFKSLINMIPGFNYLIFMGQILEHLQDDPELILVLDSPSSGHALTMLEATKNFNSIFQKGSLYQDTQTMLNLLRSPGFTRVNIITLLSKLSLQETKEFQQDLANIEILESKIFGNYSLTHNKVLNLPEFLKLKIQTQEEALSESHQKLSAQIPFITEREFSVLIKELLPTMQSLV